LEKKSLEQTSSSHLILIKIFEVIWWWLSTKVSYHQLPSFPASQSSILPSFILLICLVTRRPYILSITIVYTRIVERFLYVFLFSLYFETLEYGSIIEYIFCFVESSYRTLGLRIKVIDMIWLCAWLSTWADECRDMSLAPWINFMDSGLQMALMNVHVVYTLDLECLYCSDRSKLT
jgi:hypothetical protein